MSKYGDRVPTAKRFSSTQIMFTQRVRFGLGKPCRQAISNGVLLTRRSERRFAFVDVLLASQDLLT